MRTHRWVAGLLLLVLCVGCQNQEKLNKIQAEIQLVEAEIKECEVARKVIEDHRQQLVGLEQREQALKSEIALLKRKRK